MSEDLKIPITTPGADKAKRDLADVARGEERVGQAGKTGGEKAAQGMRAGAKATDDFTAKIVGLGASYIGLQKLLSTIQQIIAAYSRAIELRSEFTRTRVSINQDLAGPASQFGVTEDAMRDLAGGIAMAGGGGPQHIRGLGDLITAASSAGLVDVEGSADGSSASMPANQEAMITRLFEFVLQRGAVAEGQGLAKLTAKGLKGMPKTEGSMLLRLSQLQGAYAKSELSDWSDFLRGAIGGVSTMLEEGVSFETAISHYGGLAKVRKSGMAAGETIRMLGEQLFTADRPEIVKWIGEDKYWRLKRENPDALFNMILQGLMAPEGQARASLFETLKIGPELGGRLAALKGSGADRSAIRGAMTTATPGSMGGLLDQWGMEPRAQVNRGDLGAALSAASASGSGRMERIRTVAAQLHKQRQRTNPVSTWFSEAIRPEFMEDRFFLMQAVEDYYREQGWIPEGKLPAYQMNLTGDEVMWESETGLGLEDQYPDLTHEQFTKQFPRMGKAFDHLLGAGGTGGGTTIHGGTHYHLDDRKDPAGRPRAAHGATE